MSLQYIRDYYNVPAYRGRRIKFNHDGRSGVIVGASRQYLRVRFDGEKKTTVLHPTWEVEYLPEGGDK